MAWADNEVNKGDPGENPVLILLGHAAHHADNLAGVFELQLFQMVEIVVSLFLGVFSHGTGVEQDRICQCRILGDGIPFFSKGRDNHLAIEHIHLATNRLDIEMFGLLICDFLSRFRHDDRPVR